MKLKQETQNALLNSSNALFDRDSNIWPQETLLTKLQKNVLSEIR